MNEIFTKLLKLLTSFLSYFKLIKEVRVEDEKEEDMLSAENFLVYKDKRGKWRWRIKSENGRIIYASTQGYSTKHLARKNASILKRILIEIDKDK